MGSVEQMQGSDRTGAIFGIGDREHPSAPAGTKRKKARAQGPGLWLDGGKNQYEVEKTSVFLEVVVRSALPLGRSTPRRPERVIAQRVGSVSPPAAARGTGM